MLIDEVLAHKGIAVALEKLPMLSALRSAHAFVLTREAEEAATHLMRTAATPATISGQFRLPYPVTWVEWSVDGAKIGILLDGRDRDETVYCVSFVRDNDKYVVKSAGVFIPSSLEFEGRNKGSRQFAIYCRPAAERGQSILVSTAVAAMSAVAVINSLGVSVVEPSGLEHINRARAKRGKPPLIDYHTVRLRDEVRQQLCSPGETDSDGVRLHWRRGHFKARKTGLHWWNPHLAGRKELGFVEKDYVA